MRILTHRNSSLEPGLGAKAKDEHESRRGVLQVGAMSAAQSQRQNLKGKDGNHMLSVRPPLMIAVRWPVSVTGNYG